MYIFRSSLSVDAESKYQVQEMLSSMVEKTDRKREPKRNVTASSSQCVPNFSFLAGIIVSLTKFHKQKNKPDDKNN